MDRLNGFLAEQTRLLLWIIFVFLILSFSIGNAQTIEQEQASVTVFPNNRGRGEAGATVIYQHTVRQVGVGIATFDLTVESSQGWSTSVSPDVVTLDNNQEEPVLVTVVVSANAQEGDVDVATVTAASQTDPGTTGSATDTTVVPVPMYLPMVAYEAGEVLPECVLVGPPSGNPTGVDLVVTNLTLTPDQPQAGQDVIVRVTVKNQGTADVSEGNNFLIDFYDNPVPAPPGPFQQGNFYWGAQGIDFTAGSSMTFVDSFTFSAGFHRLFAQIDTDNVVAEANEANNVYGCLGIHVN
jgi:hypothetical protein